MENNNYPSLQLMQTDRERHISIISWILQRIEGSDFDSEKTIVVVQWSVLKQLKQLNIKTNFIESPCIIFRALKCNNFYQVHNWIETNPKELKFQINIFPTQPVYIILSSLASRKGYQSHDNNIAK